MSPCSKCQEARTLTPPHPLPHPGTKGGFSKCKADQVTKKHQRMTPSWEDGVTINSMWENRGRKGWEENVGCIFVLMIKQDGCAILQESAN